MKSDVLLVLGAIFVVILLFSLRLHYKRNKEKEKEKFRKFQEDFQKWVEEHPE